MYSLDSHHVSHNVTSKEPEKLVKHRGQIIVTKKGCHSKFHDHDNSYSVILKFAVIHANFTFTARKMSKYGVFSGPYFPIFGLNTEICNSVNL